MPSVADLVDEQALQHLAEQEAFQQGVECVERGCVQLVTFGPLRITAEVTDTGIYQVELRSAEKGLVWSYTRQDAQNGKFCRHSVATAVETWRRSPPRRT